MIGPNSQSTAVRLTGRQLRRAKRTPLRYKIGARLRARRRAQPRPYNLANILSFSRIVAAAPLAWLILQDSAWAYMSAFWLFVVMSLSDMLDGRLARRYGWVSNIGIFLDLTADKIYTTAILLALVTVHVLSPWPAIIILVREFVVTGLRAFAAAEGVVIPSGRWGKLKMVVTIMALGWVLAAMALKLGAMAWLGSGIIGLIQTLAPVSVWLAVILTILSGAEYLWGARGIFQPERTA